MRLRLTAALLACLATLALAAAAPAAQVDFIVSRIDASTNWQLRMDLNAPLQVAAVALEASSSLTGFSFNTANPGISLADSWYVDIGGFNALVVGMAVYGPPIAVGPITGVVLGVFSSTTSDPAQIYVRDAEQSLGGTVLDLNYNPLPPSSFSIRIVPETRAGALVGIAVALLAAVRERRATLVRETR